MMSPDSGASGKIIVALLTPLVASVTSPDSVTGDTVILPIVEELTVSVTSPDSVIGDTVIPPIVEELIVSVVLTITITFSTGLLQVLIAPQWLILIVAPT